MRCALMAAALMALAASAGCAAREPARSPDSAAAASGFDSLAALDPFLAYHRALALGEEQRFVESVPYFRRALAVPTDAWQPHCDYAISLFHAALQTETRRGVGRPVARSSAERIAWMLESEHELDVAESLTRTPADSAFVIERRARHLAAWQLGWDALSEYRRAARARPEAGAAAEALLQSLKDPVHVAPPAP